jgi:hypothetical protein
LLRVARYLAAGLLAVAVLAATASAGERARAAAGLLTEVEYSGTWKHTYTGSPGGSAQNPGSETVTAELTFTESVSLFTLFSGDGRTLGSANSFQRPVQVKLSGQATVTYSPKGALSCSVSFSARSGLKGNEWYVGGFGQPLAYISVNERETKGTVAVWAEAPGLRSSVHPEFLVHHVSGNADPTGDCGPANSPRGPVCDQTPLFTDPEYTSGDRGLDQAPSAYGFLHAVAKIDPRKTPTYTHPYHVSRVLSTCDGTDTIKANSVLTVRTSGSTGAPPPTQPSPAAQPPAPPTSLCSVTTLRRAVKAAVNSADNGMFRRLQDLYLEDRISEAEIQQAMMQQVYEDYRRSQEEERYGKELCRLIDSLTLEEYTASLGGPRRLQQVGARASAPLVSLRLTFVNKKPGTPSISVDRAGLAKLAHLPQPTALTITGKATLLRVGPVSASVKGTIRPRAAARAITSVTFGGTAANPTFVVRGTSLGTQPKPDPPVHPVGTSGCPVNVPVDDGYDYGTSLYIAVPARNWAGGRYRPSLNETDCIDLVVTRFTQTEVDLHFGRPYMSFYPKFSLDNGDVVEVGVNGATKTVHVKYGATVRS